MYAQRAANSNSLQTGYDQSIYHLSEGAAAPPARYGCLRKQLAARRGAAERSLDRQTRMGYAEDSRVSRFEGLVAAGFEKLVDVLASGHR